MPARDEPHPVRLDDSRAARLAELALAESRRAEQIRQSHAPATLKAYEKDWRAFDRWCARMSEVKPSVVALPASDDTLSLYVGALDDRAPATVRRAIAAIRLVHERSNYPMLLEEHPATVAALAGHRRRHAATPRRKKTPATDERIQRMADAFEGDTPLALRNRALLLCGFDLAFRCSELVAIDVEHLDWRGRGVTVQIRRSKGDQGGQGASGALLRRPVSPYCPVRALERWLEAGNRRRGAVFVALQAARHCHRPGSQRLSEQTVARVVKRAATLAGMPGDFSSHSLRRGLITSAFDAAESPERIRTHARHSSIDTTLGYADQSRSLGEHPGAALLGGTGGAGDGSTLEPLVVDDAGAASRLPDDEVERGLDQAMGPLIGPRRR